MITTHTAYEVHASVTRRDARGYVDGDGAIWTGDALVWGKSVNPHRFDSEAAAIETAEQESDPALHRDAIGEISIYVVRVRWTEEDGEILDWEEDETVREFRVDK